MTFLSRFITIQRLYTAWRLESRKLPAVKPWNVRRVDTSLYLPIRQVVTEATSNVAEITPASRYVGKWFVGCAGMCFGAVVIGGITRLTESGLSMTQWHLIKGIKPPTTIEEWEREFERYKQFPEYKYVHQELTLEGFKSIFFWEYIHRMWGRTIGLVFFLPAIYFTKKGWITKAMRPRVAFLGGFLVFQGLLGWYMVKSGLEHKEDTTALPRVSQYRLAAHLASALTLYTLFLWSGLSLLIPPNQLPKTRQIAALRHSMHVVAALVFFTAVSGAFVAGLDAGLTYNSWPKFADRWIPTDLFAFDPKWKNLFENPTTVQFNHRHLGEVTGIVILGMWLYARRLPLPSRAKVALNCLASMAVLQITLGVVTLLTYVPVHTAATHQGGALVLLSFALWLMKELKRIPK